MADDLTRRRFGKNAQEIGIRLVRLESDTRDMSHEVGQLHRLLSEQLDMVERAGGDAREVARIRTEVDQMMRVFTSDGFLPILDALAANFDEAAVSLGVLAGVFEKKD